MTNPEYEQQEIRRMIAEQREVERAPLFERKEAQKEYFEAMRDAPELVAERVSWLFNGSYGWAECRAAILIADAGKRVNKTAHLSRLIASEEWRCPQAFAVSAWKMLNPDQQKRIDAAIQKEIDEFFED